MEQESTRAKDGSRAAWPHWGPCSHLPMQEKLQISPCPADGAHTQTLWLARMLVQPVLNSWDRGTWCHSWCAHGLPSHLPHAWQTRQWAPKGAKLPPALRLGIQECGQHLVASFRQRRLEMEFTKAAKLCRGENNVTKMTWEKFYKMFYKKFGIQVCIQASC